MMNDFKNTQILVLSVLMNVCDIITHCCIFLVSDDEYDGKISSDIHLQEISVLHNHTIFSEVHFTYALRGETERVSQSIVLGTALILKFS